MPYTPGPFDTSHLYLQWGGKLPGNEQWSCGLRMAPVNASTSLDPQGMLAGVTTAVQTFHTAPAAWINSAVKLSFVKLNYINPAGHYAEDRTFESILADLPGGAQAAVPLHPNQVALAVSLTTGVSRGPAHRGRFYLPMPSIGPDADGLIAAAARDAVKAPTLAFIAALNAVNANYDVAVMSRKLGAPAHRLVTGVEIGRVLDTQRRRRRSLHEMYV
jgi:hypothetical protein